MKCQCYCEICRRTPGIPMHHSMWSMIAIEYSHSSEHKRNPYIFTYFHIHIFTYLHIHVLEPARPPCDAVAAPVVMTVLPVNLSKCV